MKIEILEIDFFGDLKPAFYFVFWQDPNLISLSMEVFETRKLKAISICHHLKKQHCSTFKVCKLGSNKPVYVLIR